MTRLVIYKGTQYDADKLPPHADASECVPHDEWFAQNAAPKPSPAVREPTTPDPSTTDDDEVARPASDRPARRNARTH